MSTNIATHPAVLSDDNKFDPTQRKGPSKSTEMNSQSSAMKQTLQRSVEDQIRDRAYQFYVQRGSQDGNAVQDWLDAELELLANR
jgi:hypothetical protein